MPSGESGILLTSSK